MDEIQTKINENSLMIGLIKHVYAQAARKVNSRLKGINIDKEYELIKQKKSNLSSVTCKIIIEIVERGEKL